MDPRFVISRWGLSRRARRNFQSLGSKKLSASFSPPCWLLRRILGRPALSGSRNRHQHLALSDRTYPKLKALRSAGHWVISLRTLTPFIQRAYYLRTDFAHLIRFNWPAEVVPLNLFAPFSHCAI